MEIKRNMEVLAPFGPRVARTEIPKNLIGFAQNQLVRGQNRFVSDIDPY